MTPIYVVMAQLPNDFEPSGRIASARGYAPNHFDCEVAKRCILSPLDKEFAKMKNDICFPKWTGADHREVLLIRCFAGGEP